MNDRKMVLDGMMGLVVGDALRCHIASGLYYFIAKAIVTMAPKNADFITCIQCSLFHHLYPMRLRKRLCRQEL